MKKTLFGLLAFVAIVASATPAFAQLNRAGVRPQAASPSAYGVGTRLFVGGSYVWYTCPWGTRPFYHPGGIYTYTQWVWTGWGYQPVAYQVYVPGGVYCQ